MQEASMTRGGQRFAPGSGSRASGRGKNASEDKVFKEQLVSAARGFIRAIMLGKKKWSALVQQVCVCALKGGRESGRWCFILFYCLCVIGLLAQNMIVN